MKDSVASLVFSSCSTVQETLDSYGPTRIETLRSALVECKQRGQKAKAGLILAHIEKLSGGSKEKGLGI